MQFFLPSKFPLDTLRALALRILSVKHPLTHSRKPRTALRIGAPERLPEGRGLLAKAQRPSSEQTFRAIASQFLANAPTQRRGEHTQRRGARTFCLGASTFPLGERTHSQGARTLSVGMHTYPQGLHTQPLRSRTQPEDCHTQPQGAYTQPLGERPQPLGVRTQRGSSLFPVGNFLALPSPPVPQSFV